MFVQGPISNDLEKIQNLLGKRNIEVTEYGEHSKKTQVPQIYVVVKDRIEEACEVLKGVKRT